MSGHDADTAFQTFRRLSDADRELLSLVGREGLSGAAIVAVTWTSKGIEPPGPCDKMGGCAVGVKIPVGFPRTSTSSSPRCGWRAG